MREKAKNDPEYRERLLHHISCIVTESLPAREADDLTLSETLPNSKAEKQYLRARMFKPSLNPALPEFESEFKKDMYAIIKLRNMHTHTLSCYKYSKHKKQCRVRFPRALAENACMDLVSGLITLRRDDIWVVNHHPCVAVFNKANHDVQFLYSQVDCLAKIYYVVKYVTKQEDELHSKLTIAAAVRKEWTLQRNSDPAVNASKSFLKKVLQFTTSGADCTRCTTKSRVTERLASPKRYRTWSAFLTTTQMLPTSIFTLLTFCNMF